MQCIFCCAFFLVANAVLSPRRRRDLLFPDHPGDAIRRTERPLYPLPRPRPRTDTPSAAPWCALAVKVHLSVVSHSVVGAGGATTKCSPRPRHPAQVLRGRRPPRVSPARGNPWQPRPTAGGRAGRPAAPTTWGHRRPGCGGVLAGAGGEVETRNGFTQAAEPMPGHRYWRGANRDGRRARTGESEPARGARAGRAAGVRGRGGVQ